MTTETVKVKLHGADIRGYAAAYSAIEKAHKRCAILAVVKTDVSEYVALLVDRKKNEYFAVTVKAFAISKELANSAQIMDRCSDRLDCNVFHRIAEDLPTV